MVKMQSSEFVSVKLVVWLSSQPSYIGKELLLSYCHIAFVESSVITALKNVPIYLLLHVVSSC